MDALDGLDDATLLARVLKRDNDAWRELLRRFGGLARKCIAKVVGHGVDCEDALADLSLNLLRDDMRKLRLYNPSKCQLGTWIGMLATHTACDYLSGPAHKPFDLEDARHPSVIWLLERDVYGDGLRNTLKELIYEQQRQRLQEVLPCLTMREQQFVKLYYNRELPPEEVARELGVTKTSVYVKRNKLEAKLKKLLRTER